MAYPVPGFAAWNKALSPTAAKSWISPGAEMAGWVAAGPPVAVVPGVAPTGACKTMYGPVANVCNTATTVSQTVPSTVTQLVPVTTVTPVPLDIAPQTAYGTPIPIASAKGVTPTGVGVPTVTPYGKAAPGVTPYGKAAPGVTPFGKAPTFGAYGAGIPGIAPDLAF